MDLQQPLDEAVGGGGVFGGGGAWRRRLSSLLAGGRRLRTVRRGFLLAVLGGGVSRLLAVLGGGVRHLFAVRGGGVSYLLVVLGGGVSRSLFAGLLLQRLLGLVLGRRAGGGGRVSVLAGVVAGAARLQVDALVSNQAVLQGEGALTRLALVRTLTCRRGRSLDLTATTHMGANINLLN